MADLSIVSQITLYVLLALWAMFALILLWFQLQVLMGKAMRNPDGSVDDWHEQPLFYGIALSDIILSCPACIAGIVLIFLNSKWGFFILALVGFWYLWINLVTTITSLRFHKPKFTFAWFLVFPFGAIVGLAQLVWSVIHYGATLCV
jgi:hypothetical protein